MRIDIWSDVVCPWCYIGKRRLETALASFEHAEAVHVVWHSFQLDPGAPANPTESVPEMLGRKYGGGPEAGLAMISRVDELAAAEGLTLNQAEALHANTRDAHRLLHLALIDDERRGAQAGLDGAQSRLEERLFSTHFVEGGNVADHATLTRLAVEVGLDETEVRQLLESDDLAEAVEEDVQSARELGANGVPFYVVDDRYGISGAQPTELFSQVLERAYDEREAKLEPPA